RAYTLKKYRCGLPRGGAGPPYPTYPKSFAPCRLPSLRSGSAGTASGSPRAVGGRSYSTQWTQVPRGASGSSQITTRLLVPGGGADQASGGDISMPSPVKCRGIGSPGRNAELVTVIVAVAVA